PPGFGRVLPKHGGIYAANRTGSSPRGRASRHPSLLGEAGSHPPKTRLGGGAPLLAGGPRPTAGADVPDAPGRPGAFGRSVGRRSERPPGWGGGSPESTVQSQSTEDSSPAQVEHRMADEIATAKEWISTQTPAGAVRMVVGVKNAQPLVVEATVL